MKKFLLSFLLLTAAAWGQGSSFQSQAIGKGAQGFLVPLPGASIQVCTTSACSANVSLCTDATLSTCGTGAPYNPVAADASGNYSFYAAPGNYFCKITASGFGSTVQACSVPVTPPSATLSLLNGTVMVDGIVYPFTEAGIQAAINAVPSTGGRVMIPAGSYQLVNGLTSNTIHLEIIGVGSVGSELAGASGAVTFNVPSGKVGLTFNPSGSSTNFEGLVLRNVRFQGVTGALGGVHILRSNNFLVDNVAASGFTSAGSYGFFIDGTGNINQYGALQNCRADDDNVGIKLQLTSGIRIAGCTLSGNQNHGVAITAGSIGIWGTTGTTTALAFGNVIQGFDTLIKFDAASNDQFHATRLEDFSTAAINLTNAAGANAGFQFYGGSINNSINGSIGTAVLIGAGVSNARVELQNIAAVGTVITDAGTDTYFASNDILQVPQASQIQFGSAGDNLIQRDASGRLKVTNNLLVNTLTCFNNVDTCVGRASAGVISSPLGTLDQKIASGTAVMTTAAIAAGACGTTVTVAATGVATTDAITWAYNAAPAANPAELVVSSWPTANNVNFQYCNPTAGSVTPSAATLNWRVAR